MVLPLSVLCSTYRCTPSSFVVDLTMRSLPHFALTFSGPFMGFVVGLDEPREPHENLEDAAADDEPHEADENDADPLLNELPLLPDEDAELPM
mmetsp:Transcript_13975/g.27003  ORF Transcript_13975/g.27003 Transcript_13975/m.27003 type:complete len:93 (-) Transcript_13975:38-316(-)